MVLELMAPRGVPANAPGLSRNRTTQNGRFRARTEVQRAEVAFQPLRLS